MARASWKKGSPLQKFTAGYWPHRMETTAIRALVAAKLARQSPQKLLAWIRREDRETARCLDVLGQMRATGKVQKAIANAKEHRAWLHRIRAAVPLTAPAPLRRSAKRPQRRPRVGLLAREAQAYRAKNAHDPG